MSQKSTFETGQSSASTASPSPFSPSAVGHQPGAAAGVALQTKEVIPAVARELSAEVTHMASDLAGGAKKAAESKLAAGKDFAAEHLGSVADALRKTGKELRSSDSAVTEYVEKAASSVEMVSKYFQTRTLSQLLGDVEGYARREPAVFLGGAFFVGMLGGRFLKAASPARQAQPMQSGEARLNRGERAGQASPASQGQGNRARASQGSSSSAAQGERRNAEGHGNGNQPHNQAQQSTATGAKSQDRDGANRPGKGSGAS